MKHEFASAEDTSAARSFWLRWLGISVLGWAGIWAILCSFMVPGQSVGLQVVLVAGMVLISALMGVSQWFNTRRQVQRLGWRLAVMVVNLATGFFVTGGVLLGPLTMAAWSIAETTARAGEYLPGVAATGAIGGAISGIFSGVLSGFMLDFFREREAGGQIPFATNSVSRDIQE